MVAEGEYTVPFIPKAGQEADCRKPSRYAVHSYQSANNSTNVLASSSASFKREQDEGKKGEVSGVRKDHEPLEQERSTDIIVQGSEIKKPLMSDDEDDDEQEDRLVMADTEEEEEEDGEGEQDEAEELSPGSSGDESQDVTLSRAPGWRKKIKQRVNFGRKWVQNSMMFVSTAVSMLRLSDIERSYHAACQKEGQEPLSRSVLARLLHQQFPEAGKCRLGPRKKQKIHYSKLQWRVSGSEQQHRSAASVVTPVADEAAEGTPSKGVPSIELQGRGKLPSSVSGKKAGEREGVGRGEQKKSTDQLEGDDKDEEGCQDAANNLKQVVQLVSQEGKRDVMMKTFAHSASCRNASCTPLCLMFRRVRRHIMGARHACHVLRIYSFILKVHVAFCKDDNCGLTACPALRASRQIKRDWDSEEEEELQQEHQVQQPVAKRLNRQGSNVPSLTASSPASSLPDSAPSTPSPSTSPVSTMHILQPLQYMIVVPQPRGMIVDNGILSVHDGA